MITGIGIDMIEVERIAEKIGKEQGFRELVFSTGEISLLRSRWQINSNIMLPALPPKKLFLKRLARVGQMAQHSTKLKLRNDENGKPIYFVYG